MSNYQSMAQNPCQLNLPSKYVPPRQFHAAQLAASGKVTQTAFGWHVTDSNSTHLVICTDGFYICNCDQKECPHPIAVTIYKTAYTYVKEVDTSVLPRFAEKLKWDLLPETDNFERLILQTLANICDDFLNYGCVKAAPHTSDPLRDQLEEELSQLFGNITNIYPQETLPLNKSHHERVLWPPRRKRGRPTDQQSAALPPDQLQLLIEGAKSAPTVPRSTNGHSSPNPLRNEELLSLYECTTEVFGKEIVDELFTCHLGSIPHHAPRLRGDECHPTDTQMQCLYEAFADTFGQEADIHLLFASALEE